MEPTYRHFARWMGAGVEAADVGSENGDDPTQIVEDSSYASTK